MRTIKSSHRNFSLIIAFLVLAGCGSEPESVNQTAAKQARPAKLLQVGVSNRHELLSYPAVIQAGQSSELAFQVGGVLKELNVTEAMKVAKGDVLAKLDQRDYQTQLDVANAQFESAEAEYKRALRLIKVNAIARSDLEQRKTQRDVNKSQLEAALKSLEDTVLLAPFSGNISKVSVKKLQTIQAGKAVISVLALSKLEAKINLPSYIIANARSGSNQDSSAYIVLDVAPERHIPATVKEVSLEADAELQTYEVTFHFNSQEDLNILPGMNATVWFKDPAKPTKSNLISIPLAAIATQGDSQYVWVVEQATMTVSKRLIVVEAGVGENLNIISGLEAGETIVTAGTSYLSEGMSVRPWSKD